MEKSAHSAKISTEVVNNAVQSHSRSLLLVSIKSRYETTLLVNNIYLHSVSHRLQVIADYWSNFRFR